MEVRSAVLRLSRDGISHTRYRHPDVRPEDLLNVQTILDGGLVFGQGSGRWIGYGGDAAGRLWALAWRVTHDGERAYYATLHRAEERHAARDEQRYGPPLRRKGGRRSRGRVHPPAGL